LLQEHEEHESYSPTVNLKNFIVRINFVYESEDFLKKIRYCIRLRNGYHGLICNIPLCDDNDVKIVQTFQSCSDLYFYPIESNKLEVYVVWDLLEDMKIYKLYAV